MPWTWRYEKADGTRDFPPTSCRRRSSPSQGDAESWLGENWRATARGRGGTRSSLLDDTRTEYGPMSLHPED